MPYKSNESQIMLPDDFFLPFGGKLNKENRWVKFAAAIPWWKFEEKYSENFKNSAHGQEAFSVRTALGTLIIKTMLDLSDEEIVNQIAENCYMQYFLGFPQFKEGAPFASSLITHFRKRFTKEMLIEINEIIIAEKRNNKKDNDKKPPTSGVGSSDVKKDNAPNNSNSGKLLIDATCAPADIQFPTDARLLNESREKLEDIIDTIHMPEKGSQKKPRTYRQKAHQSYINFTKQRKPKYEQIRKIKGKMLRYIHRDLDIINSLANRNGLELLKAKQYKELLIINEIYRQQQFMYESNINHIEDRIVSISQPHVRPIVRGKASAKVEFGAKVTISVVDGFTYMEKLEWDAYNESTTLIETIERYKDKTGHYPEAVLADKIFKTKENRNYCKSNNIRLSGPKLGRPAEAEKSEIRKQTQIDSGQRNEVESKFGIAKRKYTLDRIYSKLKVTSETEIMMNLLVLNLERKLRLLFAIFSNLVKRRIYTEKCCMTACFGG